MGGMAVVARHLGAKEQRRADHAVMQTILLVLGMVFLLSVIGYALAPTLLAWMGAEGALLDEAVTYCRVIFPGLLFLEMLPSVNGVMRGAGHPEYTLRSNVVNVGVMMVAEPVLVLGLGPIPRLGVAGAGAALVLGSAAGVAVQILTLLRGTAGVTIHLADARPDLGVMGRVLKVALPTAVQRFSPNLSNAILLRLISGLGTDVLTAYSVVSRFFTFLQCLSMGIGSAVTALVGQNLGGGKPKRAEMATVLGIRASIGTSVAAYGLLNLASGPILGLFLQEEPVVAIATWALLFMMASGTGAGWLWVVGSALAGAGDAVSPMLANMAALWLVQLPACWALSGPLGMGPTGIWLGMALGYLAGALALTARFRRGSWKGLTL